MTAPKLHTIMWHSQQAAQYFTMPFGSDRPGNVWLPLARQHLQQATQLLAEFGEKTEPSTSAPRTETAE